MSRATACAAAIVLLALVGCGGSAAHEVTVAPTDRASTEPSVEESLVVERPGLRRGLTSIERGAIELLIRAAERVRGLTFVRPVAVEVHDEQRISEQLARDLAKENLVEKREIYAALGLIDEGVDFEALITSVLSEQVVGYYDPEERRLVVRDDVMRRLGRIAGGLDEARVVLVHELVHALQDQRLELGLRISEERDSDPATAYRSVIEGDATLAMVGYAAALENHSLELITQNESALGSITSAPPPSSGEALERAPAILRVSLIAPYIRGLSFVAWLHGQGGWNAVDGAHRRLPASTEQV
ncbi:MAG: hypothetical protein H5U40_12380, partial [Polyangiaceae bacterium]|nr:hypothetical protein [Polyangiaceae bacterium]